MNIGPRLPGVRAPDGTRPEAAFGVRLSDLALDVEPWAGDRPGLKSGVNGGLQLGTRSCTGVDPFSDRSVASGSSPVR